MYVALLGCCSEASIKLPYDGYIVTIIRLSHYSIIIEAS